MEYIKGRLDEAINGLEGYKNKYPKMETQDVIDMLKRLLDLVDDKQLNISDVVVPKGTLCDHPRSERSYIGQNMLRCNKCGKEFS